ncbi:hypothetical protein BABINDRAFT_161029 [Babjeviella inositovora NRRL Y-12698]|uniref:Uncharacterized protein n=1 Tax=Babjeviella inositovora NRRL Y-12698 TaxID=984486 RepID=A0A1E3QSZ4_9ASCO|nr:uncharacterized protein BABINDRAFT_161029 [Babjeviella inositovora NRRL Y-12698]ODQ80825.1 hypothetical protein BABINDRAFT_161029 [Babjeviella inositovora NRRL Y-12698]
MKFSAPVLLSVLTCLQAVHAYNNIAERFIPVNKRNLLNGTATAKPSTTALTDISTAVAADSSADLTTIQTTSTITLTNYVTLSYDVSSAAAATTVAAATTPVTAVAIASQSDDALLAGGVNGRLVTVGTPVPSSTADKETVTVTVTEPAVCEATSAVVTTSQGITTIKVPVQFTVTLTDSAGSAYSSFATSTDINITSTIMVQVTVTATEATATGATATGAIATTTNAPIVVSSVSLTAASSASLFNFQNSTSTNTAYTPTAELTTLYTASGNYSMPLLTSTAALAGTGGPSLVRRVIDYLF